MIITAFDPGRETSWARFDTTRPWEIEMGAITLIGSARLLRPCPMHVADIVASSDQCIVEEVGARTKQGVSSMFSFGLHVGTILGAISGQQKPLILVTPPQWKAASRLGGLGDDEAKNRAREYALELWPQNRTQLAIKKNHGMADAALMARWYFLKGPGRDIDIPDGPMSE